MKYAILSIICIAVLFGCKPITQSIKETLNPHDSVVVKHTKPSAPAVPDVQTIIDSQVKAMTTLVHTHTSQHIESHVNGTSKNFLADQVGLEKAEQLLRNMPGYAGKEIFIYQSVYFYDDGSISVMLRHPKNPNYVDQYHYTKGTWSDPVPVQLSVKDDIKSKLITLDQLRFRNAAMVAKLYRKKVSSVLGAKPDSFVYATIWNNKIQWFPIHVNGSRERYSITFNADGTLTNFSRD